MLRYFCAVNFRQFFLCKKLSSLIEVEEILNLTLLYSEFVEGEEDNRTDEISSFNRFTCA